MGGIETRRTSKFERTLAMKRACLPIVETCKVKGKLLITSRIVQIK
jgi:hypothetical protein